MAALPSLDAALIGVRAAKLDQLCSGYDLNEISEALTRRPEVSPFWADGGGRGGSQRRTNAEETAGGRPYEVAGESEGGSTPATTTLFLPWGASHLLTTATHTSTVANLFLAKKLNVPHATSNKPITTSQ